MGKQNMMYKKSNLVGQRFNRLVVIAATESYINETGKKKHSRWVCKCDCGNTCITTGTSLKTGKKQSCNCLRRETSRLRAKVNSERKTYIGDEGSFCKLYAVYKWQASKRNFTFELTKELFKEITSMNCFY